MKPAGQIPLLGSLNTAINKAFAALAAIALVGLMFITVVDIVLRNLGMPVAGSFELIGWLSATSMGLALGYVQLHRGHVAVTAISERFKGRLAAAAEIINSALALALVALLTYYTVRLGLMQKASGSLSETLRFLVYPWVFALSAGLAGLALALLVDFLRAFFTLFLPNQSDQRQRS